MDQRSSWCKLALSLLFVVYAIQSGDAQALTPPNFNLAVGRKVEATSTCGVGVTEPELYCKLTGANPDKEDVIGEFEVIQGQLCDYCDAREPSKSHQPEYAVDGTERWWQSPPLSRGLQYNEVNLTISLGQEFHVAYIFIKMANSPRPGVFALERSKDYGETWQPWQYFADTRTDCEQFFGEAGYSQTITGDDAVICTTDYSKVVPLEGGEIVISLVNNRPSANNFSYSQTLQDWTRATTVRLRLLRTKTLLGHLMAVARQDPTVTRRYYYSIKDISVGGRCVCNGHADSCDLTDPNNPLRLVCRCQHNTCGDQCDKCCPGFVQKPWRPATLDADNACEPCQCYGHTDECRYNDEVAKNQSSVDIHGQMSGGGVCLNCQHNTAGVNCEMCRDGFYRPFGVELDSLHVCRRCRCEAAFSTGNCETGTGRCICRPEYAGVNCDRCNVGYYGYPRCVPCQCHVNGTQGQVCEVGGGQCPCKPNFDGFNCDECAYGYYDFPSCKPCDCDGIGSLGRSCDVTSGQCRCRPNYGGRNCGECAAGYYNYPACQQCDCNDRGTTSQVCDAETSECLCEGSFTGPRCDRCATGFYRFPRCLPCGCDEVGRQVDDCDNSGQCICKHSFTGRTCDRCAAGFYRHPECISCNCDSSGSYGVSCDQQTGQCDCRPTFDGLTCNKCKPNFYNYPICEECSCDPAGAKEVPGYPLGGCGAYSNGQLCECKEHVAGRICDTCKPGYWNLRIRNAQGCEDCGCHVEGTVGWSRYCHVLSGQCQCRPFVNSRRCDECVDGAYNLQQHNAFGCQPCDCDVGGTRDATCDKSTGQCRCKPRVNGRRCDSPIATHYFPTLYHDKYELEDGYTPTGSAVRYGFDSRQFAEYSWRGYAVYSRLQDEVLVNVDVNKPGLYRIIYRYVNPTGDDVVADVTVTPETSADITQSSHVTFGSTARSRPQFASVSTGSIVTTFVLNPGPLSVALKCSPGVLVDYMVLMPEAYYAATILQQKIYQPCTVPPTANMCRRYSYVDMSAMSSARTSDGFSADRDRTQLYRDSEILQGLGKTDMAHLNRRQTSLTLNVPVRRHGDYVLVLDYYTQQSDTLQELDVELVTAAGSSQRGSLKLPTCPYSALCRQPVLDSSGNPMEFSFDSDSATVTLTGRTRLDVALDLLTALPVDLWTFDYVTAQFVCLQRDGQCVSGSYTTPTGTVRVDFELTPNEHRVVADADIPSHIVADSVTLVKLDRVTPQIAVTARTPDTDNYVVVVHYYQPDVSGFDIDVSVMSLTHSYTGKLVADYCPSVTGCRSVVEFKDVADMKTIEITDDQLRLAFNSSHADVWLDYVMLIPATQFEPTTVLDVQGVDMSSEFIKTCGADHFHLNSSVTGFCRDSVFSLTTDYNNGALRCDCSPDGAVSFNCEQFGGQCRCRPNIIGRTCSHCRTGYYGFPDCRRCECASGLCDPRTGQCICPPRVTGPDCDVCLPQTFGFDPLIGCEDCACESDGVRRNNQDCDITTGQCSCKQHIAGRRCDKCEVGYAGFPRCHQCNCDISGVTSDVCDQQTAQCICKSNVEGARCSECKPNSFYLEERNPNGCTRCFCFGVTTRCEQSQLRRSQVSEMTGWGVTNLRDPDIRLDTPDDTVSVNVNDDLIIDSNDAVFWIAPQVYRGNKVTSYGGKLTYTILVRVPQDIPVVGVVTVDVRLEGNNLTVAHVSMEQPVPGVPLTVSVDLLESKFVHERRGSRVSREQFMMVLSNIRVLHIRASYFSIASMVFLSEVKLDVADVRGSGEMAYNVEQCRCPANYVGSSCERCAEGYYRSKEGPYLGTCVPCECNNRADTCDPISGACVNCQDNFDGPQCLKCRRGYYHDTQTQVCLVCSCPMPVDTNNFAYTCEVNVDGSTRSCRCLDGYQGSHCDSCEIGYWGNPLEVGSRCEKCQCSGNIDLRDPLSCDQSTGECVRCINHAAGDHCERCMDWYHGDAVTLKNCQPCDCDKTGTQQCHHRSGVCECLPNVVGRRCHQCAPESFGFNSGDSGCDRCDCGTASVSRECDSVTGQCQCQPGVTGRRCDECQAGYWNYGRRGCQPCQCMSDGAVTCDPVSGSCQCLPGVTGPNCDECLPRWVMIENVGCRECDSCVHLLVDDVELLEHNISTMVRSLENVNVGVLAMRRLDRINVSVTEIRPLVDMLTTSPTDPTQLDPLKNELASIHRLSDDASIRADRLTREAEVVAADAAAVRLRAESLIDDVIQMAVDAANDAVNYARRVLEEITNNVSLQNVDELLRQAEQMLTEIRRRDFSEKTHEVQEELARAIEALNRAKSLLDKATVQANTTKIYFERLIEIRRLLLDLKNHTDQSTTHARDAVNKNEENRRLLRTILELIEIIKITQTQISGCLEGSHELLSDARRHLNDAGDAYKDVERELSRLDVAHERLRLFVNSLASENSKLKPLVVEATDHARRLQIQADELDSLIADTRESAAAALNASNAYKSIIDAINKAWNASMEAVKAAEDAKASMDSVDEARRLRETSDNLRNRAISTAMKIEEELKPRILSVNLTLMSVNELIREIRVEIEDIVLGLDMLPERGYGEEAVQASAQATKAQQQAEAAETKVQQIVDELPEAERRVSQIPRDIEAARKDVRDAHSQVNRVLDLVPTAISLLDRLRIQADRIRQLGSELSVNISNLRSQVDVARDQANLIRVGVKFDPTSQLQVRNPKNMLAVGSYSTVSLYFKTNTSNGLLFYLGPDVGPGIVDYMSLEVVNGRVQFRCDLGSGPMTLTSDKVVNDDVWHQVIVERSGKQGKLTVRTQDEENDVKTGHSAGTYSVLDLTYNTKFFVGGVVDRAVDTLKPAILTSARFTGCMEGIMFNGRIVGPWNFAEAHSIHGCDERGNVLPEVAPKGFEFGGSGYVIISKGNYRPERQSPVKFSFRTFATEGLMMLMGTPGGDFLSIELVDGKVVGKYDLGSGIGTLPAQKRFNDGRWHDLYMNRIGNDGLLKIDNLSEAGARSPGSTNKLQIDNIIYFGGYKGNHTYPTVTQVPFKGCIKDVQLGSLVKDLNENIEFKDVSPGCTEAVRMISFDHDTGGGYIAMPTTLTGDEQLQQLTMTIKSEEKDGLIFYVADDPSTQSNAFSMSLVDGKIVVMHVVNGQTTALETNVDTYGDGMWHYITVTKENRNLQLDIDDSEILRTRIQGRSRLSTRGSAQYFGGVPDDYTVLTTNVGSRTRFIGCIADAVINNESVNFANAPPDNIVNVVLGLCHIDDPTPPPPSLPTNGAVFTLPTVPTGIPPEHCQLPLEPEIPAEVPEAVRFGIEPESRFEYSSFPRSISTQTEFSIELKTRATEGVVLYMSNVQHVDFIALYLKDGRLSFAFNCGSGVARATTMFTYNDDLWHTVKLSRDGQDGTLDVDDQFEMIDLSSSGQSRTVEVNAPYFVGGMPLHVATDAAHNLQDASKRFIGCLRNLRQNGVDVGAPSYSVGTEPCTLAVEQGSFFYTDAGHLQLYDSYVVPLDVEISVEVKPRSLSGVLLSVFNHGAGPPGGDFLVLQLVNGQVIFSMDNGQGEIAAVYSPTANNELCDGFWHRITAVKAKNVVTLEVDGVMAQPGLGVEGVSHTNTNDPLYVGGVPEFHRGIKTHDQFVGCLRNLRLGGVLEDLTEARSVGRVNLVACPVN